MKKNFLLMVLVVVLLFGMFGMFGGCVPSRPLTHEEIENERNERERLGSFMDSVDFYIRMKEYEKKKK